MKYLLESVIENFQTRLQAKSISLKKLVRPVEITGIHEQLRSIIEQLLSNAVKYSPVGGELRIMLRDSGTQMELEVEDEGPGIEPNERSHVFEPFFRGKTAQSDESVEGPGLGLAIVKEYVVNHQGRVEIIDSRQDQHGARIPRSNTANRRGLKTMQQTSLLSLFPMRNISLTLSLLLLTGCAEFNSGWEGSSAPYTYTQSDFDELLAFGANMANISPSSRAEVCRTLLKRQKTPPEQGYTYTCW